MVGTWVGAPPEWRMEERYLKNLEDVKGRDYTVKRDKANGRISYNIKIVKKSITKIFNIFNNLHLHPRPAKESK